MRIIALVGSLAVVGVGAGMAYGVATVIGGTSEESETRAQQTIAPAVTADASTVPGATATPAGEKTWPVQGALLITGNRQRLDICVQAVNLADAPDVETLAVEKIQEALSRVKENPGWERALGRAPLAAQTHVNVGCPTEPAIYDPNAGPEFGEYVGNNDGRIVDQASPYRVHVYILSEEEIFRVVGPPEGVHSGTEEKVCGSDVCEEVTDGLYLSPARLTNNSLLVRELEYDLGLP